MAKISRSPTGGNFRSRPIIYPQNLQQIRTLRPSDQLSLHYGYDGARNAIRDARELSQQIDAIDAFGRDWPGPGAQYRDVFPAIQYPLYEERLGVVPVPEGGLEPGQGGPGNPTGFMEDPPVEKPDPTGFLTRPDDYDISQNEIVQLLDGSVDHPLPTHLKRPTITYGQPDVDPLDLGFDPEARRRFYGGSFGLLGDRAARARSIEEPMTDFVTGMPSDLDEDITPARLLGNRADRVLAQLRRNANAVYLDPVEADALINRAIAHAATMDPYGIEPMTGMRAAKVTELGLLPAQFRGRRIRELPGIIGVTSSLLSDRDTDMTPMSTNSTMGMVGGMGRPNFGALGGLME